MMLRLSRIRFQTMFYKAQALYALFRFEEALIHYHRKEKNNNL